MDCRPRLVWPHAARCRCSITRLVAILGDVPSLRCVRVRISPASRCQGTIGPPKVGRAARLTGAPPRIDGVLDDPVWAQAPVIADFVQKIPVEGASPSVPTEVRILYDDHGLYVAARLKRPDPNAIRTSITRRDGDSDAEVFTISLDPYLDRRTAYSFSISSGGVRGDAYHSQDSEDSGREAQYDPVWDARARVDAEGWTAEMHIPFSQLRFNAAAEQTWGLELTRSIPDKNERLQWILIPVSRRRVLVALRPARRHRRHPAARGVSSSCRTWRVTHVSRERGSREPVRRHVGGRRRR